MIGQRVIYTNPSGGYETDDISMLILGKVYTVKNIEILSSDMFFEFEEIAGLWFNSVHFSTYYF